MSDDDGKKIAEQIGHIAASLEHIHARLSETAADLRAHVEDESARLQRTIDATQELRAEVRDLYVAARVMRWLLGSVGAIGGAVLWLKDYIRLH